jgi:septal ring factor EnvC (AmiA/AmiB activator)
MTEVAELYTQIGITGVVVCLFAFMIKSLIDKNREQSDDLDEIQKSISQMQSEISNSQQIVIKLVDRINRSSEKREEFWREISDDLSFLKGRINGKGGN